jgi:hypothetical protein
MGSHGLNGIDWKNRNSQCSSLLLHYYVDVFCNLRASMRVGGPPNLKGVRPESSHPGPSKKLILSKAN